MIFDAATFDATNIVLMTSFHRVETDDFLPPYPVTVYRKGGIKEVYNFNTKPERLEALWRMENARNAANDFDPWES
jgi:hypothetical protein